MFNKIFLSLFSFFILIGTTNLSAKDFCSEENILEDINGKWEGSDSYYLLFKTKNNKLCISVEDNHSNTNREVRDIILRDGKLFLFTYYTPSTDGFTVYQNINFKGSKMFFKWLSIYGKGDDIYYKTNN